MLTAILPCYNEEENIQRFETELIPYLDSLPEDFEVLIIDDGSKDKTYEAAKELKKKNDRVKVIQHKKNLGLGAGIKTGIANSIGDKVVILDSDLTFHPRQIKSLYDKYVSSKYDCVIGSPNLNMSFSSYDESVPKYRIFLSKVCNWGYSVLLNKKLTAMSPIFRMYNGDALRSVTVLSEGFVINAEIIFRFVQKGLDITEVPAVLESRIHGVSKINNFKEIINHLRIYYLIFKWRIRSFFKFS